MYEGKSHVSTKDPIHFQLSHLILFLNASSEKEELFLQVFLCPRRQAQALVGGSLNYKWLEKNIFPLWVTFTVWPDHDIVWGQTNEWNRCLR